MPDSSKGDSDPLIASTPVDAKLRLSSWKAIASYFQRDVRTVQLWERNEGLPVHRHEHGARASVYAYPSELDQWFNLRARKQVPESASVPTPYPSSGDGVPAAPATAAQPLHHSFVKAVVVLIVFALLAAGGWLGWQNTHPHPTPVPGTLVVLPFLNLTGDSNQDYLSDGLTDELTTLFASRLGLQVVARTSAFEFKGKPDDVRSIGKRLNAAMVLEGSLRKVEDQIRVNAQLVRTSDGIHIWSHIYDAPSGETGGVEEKILRDVAGALKLPTPPNAIAPETSLDEQAHALYLRGEYWWNRRSPSDEWKAVNYFNEAIEREPLYARAYLGLALAYLVLGVNDQAPPSEVLPKARAAAQKALQIDPHLNEAHTVLAHINFSYDWDYQDAEKEFRLVVSANPSYVPARHFYGLMLMYQGRFVEAEREFREAAQLDPLSPIFPALLSRLDLYMGRYDEAIEICKQTLRGNPDFPLPHYALGQIYLYQHRYTDALAELQKYYELSNHDPDALANFAMVYASMGDRAKALQLLKEIQNPQTGYSSEYNDALIYAALGDKEHTYSSLDQAIARHSPALMQLLVDPAFRFLHSEPRFEQMLRRTGHSA